MKYFFEGGNPRNVKVLNEWQGLEQSVKEMRPILKELVEVVYK